MRMEIHMNGHEDADLKEFYRKVNKDYLAELNKKPEKL